MEMLHEAAAPYAGGRAAIAIAARPGPSATGSDAREPIGARRPGVIYGLGNIIENAVDFAERAVDISAEWDAGTLVVTILDDGPGFQPEIIDTLGEPYVTTRPAPGRSRGEGKDLGLGLGFFIAKTLLERSGAKISLDNRTPPLHGAVVRIVWPRGAFDIRLAAREGRRRAGPTRAACP